MKIFPTCLFAPDNVHADIERRTLSGGEALNGDEDLIATDGGGRAFVEFGDPFLWDAPVANVWRAASAYLDGGAVPIIVPFCDPRHQPTMGPLGTQQPIYALQDEADYNFAGDAEVTLAVSAALRATTLIIAIDWLSRPLIGGEWLSIDHPNHRWRAYRVSEVVSQSASTATIRIRTPLREAVAQGAIVDFSNPRCVMRLDGDMRSPSNIGYAEGSGARFVEHFPGSGGY